MADYNNSEERIVALLLLIKEKMGIKITPVEVLEKESELRDKHYRKLIATAIMDELE